MSPLGRSARFTMSLVTVMIPCYNESGNVRFLYERLTGVASQLQDHEFEFLFADDGSSDGTFPELSELAQKDSRVKLIKLSRNFGSHAALAACLQHGAGDCAISLSADLQDPPELIPELLSEWKEGNDVVWAERGGRDDPLLIRVGSLVYFWIMRKLMPRGVRLPRADVFLIDRKVISIVSHLYERNTSIFGLIAWVGFRQASISYRREARRAGASGWTLAKKVKLAIDSCVSFSYFPMRLMSAVGILLAFLGIGYGAFILFRGIFLGFPVMGWASLMVTMVFLSGIQLMVLGVLGEYLWRTLDEGRRRPRFIVERTVNMQRQAEERKSV